MKKLALSLLFFALPIGIAGAASVNGEYEGNPIVNVQSNGQSLKAEEVPAVIYNGRTVVPIAMLRQLGAAVTWDAKTYSVNVTLPSSPAASAGQSDPAEQERALLSNAYQWLKDTDTAIWMFTQQLQQYYDLADSPAGFSQQLDEDYQQLMNKYNESLQMALKVTDKVKKFDDIRSITQSESNAISQVAQAKSLLQMKMSGTAIADLDKNFRISRLNATRAAQQNLNHTTDIIHKLQAQDLHISDSSSVK